MRLGKHCYGVEKALSIVRKFNQDVERLNNIKDEDKREIAVMRLNYSDYAVARQVLLNNGYTWTANYRGKYK